MGEFCPFGPMGWVQGKDGAAHEAKCCHGVNVPALGRGGQSALSPCFTLLGKLRHGHGIPGTASGAAHQSGLPNPRCVPRPGAPAAALPRGPGGVAGGRWTRFGYRGGCARLRGREASPRSRTQNYNRDGTVRAHPHAPGEPGATEGGPDPGSAAPAGSRARPALTCCLPRESAAPGPGLLRCPRWDGTGRNGTGRGGAFRSPSTSPSGSRCPVPGARRVRASRPRLRPSPERGRARRGGGAGGRCQPIAARGLLRSSQWQRAAGIPGGRDPGGAHGWRVGRSRECGVEWARGLARVRTQRRGWRGREG